MVSNATSSGHIPKRYVLTPGFCRFCIKADDNRPKERSTCRLFEAISKYAPNIPLVVVATHMDVLEGTEYLSKQRSLMREGRTMSQELHNECDAFSKERLESRVEELATEMREVLGEQHEAQMVSCVGVSKGNPLPNS